MIQDLRASCLLLLIFTVLTGVAYPLAITALGQSMFPLEANGSLIVVGERVAGSSLIGQNFSQSKYFHSRPSAAGDGYDGGNSSGSNLAPTAPDFIKTVTERVAELRGQDGLGQIPIDLVTASGSGLDPDISVSAALFQAERVAAARGFTVAQIKDVITHSTTPRTFGVLGENRVNVMKINQALDMMSPP